eukprot:3377637-Pleurochrysis_carterae.AAC.1
MVERVLDCREEVLQVLTESPAAAVHGVRALRMEHLRRMEQRVSRLDVLVVPETTQNGDELAQRLGVVQPVLRP